MTSWKVFAAEEPDFAQRVQSLFAAHRHHTMATLRRDGSPRISGTEVDFSDDGLALGMMGGSFRAADLRRDGRVALHSCTVDPAEDPALWPGDAKISGTAFEVEQRVGPPGSDRFVIDVIEVAITRVGIPADHLVIEAWHSGRGIDRVQRR